MWPLFLIAGGAAAFVYWYFYMHEPADTEKYVKFLNEDFRRQWAHKRIPISTLYEAYFAGHCEFREDVLDALKQRHNYVSYKFTWSVINFVVTGFLPDVLFHSRSQDEAQVRDHYDRGNDFFEWFLGPTMIYTSAYFTKDDPTDLERAQTRKMNRMCTKLHIKPGMTLLDIGCGWGTLVRHAGRWFGARGTGVTLARNQVEYATKKSAELELSDLCKFECKDYRDITKGTKFDRITCIEMAEHVGVRKFKAFMRQIYNLTEDNGLFMLQVAGLRRAWQFEDLAWGLFMNKYVFPGADASTPLGFYVEQLERAGWEVTSLENIGVHYAMTIHQWYNNWMKNRDQVEATYGKVWFKTWEFFLAWSAIIPRLGSATCWQFVCHKNVNHFDRFAVIVPDENDNCPLDNHHECKKLPGDYVTAARPAPRDISIGHNGAPIENVW